MKTMTETSMREMNGGATYTYYKCTICGRALGAKWAIKLHCSSKHGISSCWKTVYYNYKLF